MLTRRTLVSAAGLAAAAPLLWHRDLFPAAWAATPRDVAVMAKQIDDVVSFDPAESYEFTDNEVDANTYRRLVHPNAADPDKVDGDLAERWDVAAGGASDGGAITFHLRSDAVFDSGKPVTAADVEFSLHRVVRLNKAPGFIITQFGYTPDNVAALIRATDDRTLEMKLPTPQATSFVLYCLSANVGSVVEKAAALANQKNDDLGNDWLRSHSAGAGPYKLTSWGASDHIILDANPHSGIPVKVRRVAIRHVAEPSAQLLLLQRGDADIARNLTSDQLRGLANDAAYHVVASPQMSSMYVAMNQNVPNLAKPEVRQAIKWAIDYEAIAKNITPNTWSVSQSFLPKGMPGALDELPFKQDIDRAKKLMEQAGLAGGFGVTMDYISVSPYGEIAQAVQADLGKIGIQVQLLPGEQKQVITKTRARTHQLAMLYWGSDYFDPNSNAQGFCANPDDGDNSKLKILAWRSHFVDPELTRDAAKAATENDTAARLALYGTMQRRFWDVAPFAIALQQNNNAVLRKDVTGFVLGPMPDFTRYAPISKG